MRLPGLSTKILGSGGPTYYGARDPPNASFGGPRPHGRWYPQTPIFFWEVQEVSIGPPEKFKWLVKLLHGFFEPNVIAPKSL